MGEKRYFAAYAENISAAGMLRRCPDAKYVGTAEIKNQRLVFRGGNGVARATLDKKARRKVPAVIWMISEADEEKLDSCKSFPRICGKQEFNVDVISLIDGEKIAELGVFTYVCDTMPLGRPSDVHYRCCEDGYRYFGFDPKVLEKARQESTAAKKPAAE